MSASGNPHPGELIKQLRIAAGWSQEELGRKVNATKNRVREMESSSVMKTSTLQRVLGLMGYDLVYTAIPRGQQSPECPDGVRGCHGMHDESYHSEHEEWRHDDR